MTARRHPRSHAGRGAQPAMTRTGSLGSHRLRRCTDLLYIPFSALLIDDRHFVSCGELSRSRYFLAREPPIDGHRDVACVAASGNRDIRYRGESDRAAEAGERNPRCEVAVQGRLVAARVRLEKGWQLAR